MEQPPALSSPPPINDWQAVQRIKDAEHLNLLKVFYYIMAGLSAVGFLFLILHAVIVFSVMPAATAKSSAGFPQEMMWIIGLFYLIGFSLTLGIGLMNFFCARFLGQRKHRVFCMVTGAINLISIPFGTALGVFTFIVLNRATVGEVFATAEDRIRSGR